MIYGELLSKCLQAMNDSRIEFHLTGSRHFGNVNENSDWDFFVANSPELETFLHDWDFHVESESSYLDMFRPVIYRNWNIHIQAIENVELKRKAQAFLSRFPFFVVPKDKRGPIWDWAVACVRIAESR